MEPEDILDDNSLSYLTTPTDGNAIMAPALPRKAVPKDRFPALFATLKTQTYHDPSTRGPGSHTYASINPPCRVSLSPLISRAVSARLPGTPPVI